VPFVVAGPVVTIPRQHLGLAEAELLVLVAVAIGGLQLRHSLAAARGGRPAAAAWTFVAICVLVYVPLRSYSWDWSIMQWFVVASAATIVPRPWAAVVAAGPILGTTFVYGWYIVQYPAADPGFVAVATLYIFTLLAAGSTAIVGSAWLARTLTDLDRARHEQASLAAARERVRVSRDLHDLLGHSLATASLKGDLALRLLPTDPAAARAEMADLAAAARRALDDVRAVTHDAHAVTLRSEIEGATALLGAAGIHTAVDIAEPDLGRAEEALAWVVREAATNTLRHSDATSWSLTVRRTAGRIRLTVVNDGAPPPDDRTGVEPGGLAGVEARARALSGRANAHHTADGRFRLEVEIPAEQQ
jgi:two-component system sensor histidine kinase DesK